MIPKLGVTAPNDLTGIIPYPCFKSQNHKNTFKRRLLQFDALKLVTISQFLLVVVICSYSFFFIFRLRLAFGCKSLKFETVVKIHGHITEIISQS